MKDEREIYMNIGTGEDLTVKELAEKIKNIIGYVGEILRDTSKPNGTPKKLLNVDKLKESGWTYQINLDEGIKSTYEWFLKNR